MVALRDLANVVRAFKSRAGPSKVAAVRPPTLAPVASRYGVSVIGLGYVGLPTAALLAGSGKSVAGCDIRTSLVERINLGQTSMVEPGLESLLSECVTDGRLRAFDAPVQADVHLICVPTPAREDGSADLTAVISAAAAVLRVAEPGDLIVLESTIPPGTTRQILARRALALGFTPGQDIFLAHAPERVLPGSALREVVENARIVGGVTERCTEVAAEFYRSFVSGTVHTTSSDAAEVAKLAENSFRDVNIGFANELANICGAVGIDPWEVIRLANQHPRVSILNPGPGVGGHCIAVDPRFLAHAAPHESPLLQAARAVNEERPHRVVAEVRSTARKFREPKIACLGLTYKPDIDDLRESPALEVARMLVREEVGTLLLVEPHLEQSPIPGVDLVDTELGLALADIVVILVAHSSFKRVPTGAFTRPCVIDTVGLTKSVP